MILILGFPGKFDATKGQLFDLFLNSGTQYLQQSYKVSDTFPFKWINKKWREGFYVTAMATAGSRWGVVMSRGAGFSDQVYLIFQSVTTVIGINDLC